MMTTSQNPESVAGSGVALKTYQPENMGVLSQPDAPQQAGAAALAARVEAEVKARTFVALQRPRNTDRFRQRLLESCQSQRFADAAWYKKPIGGGHVFGFSIRFAEECARFYGNLDISSDIISEDDERRVVQCCVVDLESNVPWRTTIVVPKTVERRNPKSGDEIVRVRTNSQGVPVSVVKATDDQIFTTQMALTSKSVRNLILAHIPSDIKEEAEDAIRATQAGEVDRDPVKYRRKMVDAFFAVGVTVEQLTAYLGHALEEATPVELFDLGALGKAIKAGEGTWADVIEAKRRTAPTTATEETTPPSKGADRVRAATGAKATTT